MFSHMEKWKLCVWNWKALLAVSVTAKGHIKFVKEA